MKGLPWNPKNAATSAIKALSKFCWEGVPKKDAIERILSLPEAAFLRDAPWILYSAWEDISREINGEPIPLLELGPIFDAAA